MGIKLIIFALVFASNSYGTEFETQLKYQVRDSTMACKLVHDSIAFDGFSTYYHSTYTYYDLYLDTPEFDLYKNGLSLRFRKRIFNEDEISYSFQLKSEMSTIGEVRMEIEEKELDFYRVELHKNWMNLSALLDLTFASGIGLKEGKESALFTAAVSSLNNWIVNKAEAPIAPFQKLRTLNTLLSNPIVLDQLSPVVIGWSNRDRIHVYINQNDSTNKFHGINNNPIPKNEIPTFFKTNKYATWVMEASLDNSRFYSLFNTMLAPIQLREFEVEGKYHQDSVKNLLLNSFDNEVRRIMKLTPVLESKYKQVIMQHDQ